MNPKIGPLVGGTPTVNVDVCSTTGLAATSKRQALPDDEAGTLDDELDGFVAVSRVSGSPRGAGIHVGPSDGATASSLGSDASNASPVRPSFFSASRFGLGRDDARTRSSAAAAAATAAAGTTPSRSSRASAAQPARLMKLLRALLTPTASGPGEGQTAALPPEPLSFFFLAFLGRLATFTGTDGPVPLAMVGGDHGPPRCLRACIPSPVDG